MCEKLRDFAMSSTVTYLKLMLLHQLLETGMSVPTGQIPTQQSVSGNIQCNPGSGIFFLDGATLPCKQRGTSYCHTIIEQEDVQFCLKTCCSKAKKPDAVGPSDKSDSDANRWKEISPKRPTNSSGPTPVERAGHNVNDHDSSKMVSPVYRDGAIVAMVFLAISLAANVYQCRQRGKSHKIEGAQYRCIVKTPTEPHPVIPPIAMPHKGGIVTAV